MQTQQLISTELFNIAVNDYDATKSIPYSQVFVLNELVVNGTQCTYLTSFEQVDLFLQDGISVLLQESVHLVLHIIREVVDDKRCARHPGFGEVFAFRMFVVQLLHPVCF